MCILKVKPIGFAARSDIAWEREKGLKDDAKVSAFTDMRITDFNKGVCLSTNMSRSRNMSH